MDSVRPMVQTWRMRVSPLRQRTGGSGLVRDLVIRFEPFLIPALTAALLTLIAACGSFAPQPYIEVGFVERAVSDTKEDVTVSVAALGAEEAKQAFGVSLFDDDIQPVWLRIQNNRSEPIFLAPAVTDPLYYSPTEAAFISHTTFHEGANKRIDEHFRKSAIAIMIAAGDVEEGFLFTQADLGAKAVPVALLSREASIYFPFVVEVPGLKPDFGRVDFDVLYSETDFIDHDLAGLRTALEGLPCCAKTKDGRRDVDPLNLVLIGDGKAIIAALASSGWDLTERVTTESAWKTGLSYLFGSVYRYSPVSDLYVFGRHQDAALQKARTTIHERNHLRLWLTSRKFDDKPVWLGAISRDIGVIFTEKNGSRVNTHKIDPSVDDEQWYLVQDLLRVKKLKRAGFVRGGPISRPGAPLHAEAPENIYFSDGLRIVIEVADDLVDEDDVEWLPWETRAQIRKELGFEDSP